jgi:hypothetical protein
LTDLPTKPPETSEQAEAGSFVFGLERVGLLPLRFPLIATIVLLVLGIAAAFGIQRIKVDDSLSQLFRSDTEEFRQFEEVTRRFPSAEFDVLVVIEGDVLARQSLQAMRDLVIDLQLVDGTRGIISLFSAREPPVDGGIPEPLFPAELPEEAEFNQLAQRVLANEIIRGKLLSEDGKLALIVLALDPDVVQGGQLRPTMAEIREMIEFDLEGAPVVGRLSGVPMMQLEIRNAVERDRLIYNAIGFIAGCLIAVLFFRRISFMMMAAAPPLLAILFSLGFLGWLDFRLNMFLNVMTPLIMVMGFSDSMQITFAARDRLLAGESKLEALKNATLVVGPAVVITDLTAALSFIALIFSNSHLIRSFGMAGAISCLIAFLAVVTLVPLFGMLLVRKEAAFAAKVAGTDRAVDALRSACSWIADRMIARPGLFSLLSLIVVVGLTFLYTTLDPHYRLADQVPDRDQAVSASDRIDEKLQGANPIDILVQFPDGKGIYDEESLEVLAAVHGAAEGQTGVANVWSVETLRRWLTEKLGRSDVETLQQYIEVLPEHLTGRFLSPENDAIVISGRIPDADASELLPIVDSLDSRLEEVRAAHPDYQIAVTGLSAIAARNSSSMITQLSENLSIEMLFVAALIGLAFRSVFVMLIAILPGLFPIVISGAVLFLLNEGLQFASVVALTVAFGLGLDATIHYLNRLRLEHKPGEDPAIGVKRATVLVGPALILTSLVLACGLGVTVFSDLPSLRLFGWLSAFTLIAALIGDLLILPATVMFLRRLGGRIRRSPAPKQEPPPYEGDGPSARPEHSQP